MQTIEHELHNKTRTANKMKETRRTDTPNGKQQTQNEKEHNKTCTIETNKINIQDITNTTNK